MMRSGRRKSAAFVLALTLLLALSGCVKIDMDLDIQADNTVGGTMIIAVDKDLLAASGQSAARFLKQFETQGPFSGENRPAKGTFSQRRYDTDGKIGQAYTFKGVPLSEFGGDEGLTITRMGDRFIVNGVLDMATVTPSDAQEWALAEQFGNTAETRIRMTFPGEVLKSNGKIDGRSVTWNPKIGEKTPISAEARATAIIPVLLAVGGAVALLLLILGLTIFFLVRRSRRRNAPAMVGEYGAGEYDAGGYAGDTYSPPAYQQQGGYQPGPQPAGYPPGPPPPAGYPPGSPPPAGYRPLDATQPLPQMDPNQPGPPGRG